MSYEDRYDAMNDYDLERQGEGREEALNDVILAIENDERELYTKNEILELVRGLEWIQYATIVAR